MGMERTWMIYVSGEGWGEDYEHLFQELRPGYPWETREVKWRTP